MRNARWVAIMLMVPLLAGCGALNPLNAQRMVRVETTQSSGQAKVLLCLVNRTGGKPGVVEHLSVGEDGTVNVVDVVGNEGRSPRMMQASSEQFNTLQQAVSSNEWQGLEEEYGSATTEGVTYDIHCGGTQLLVHEGAQRPAVVDNVIRQLETLWQQAEQQ